MNNKKKYCITIVTVALNAFETLACTVDSILPQMDSDVEYWIIDGGSGKATEEYLNSLERYGIHSISEKDDGIYDAMNKGLKLSRGEWIVFVNAGDHIMPGALSIIKKQLDPDLDGIYCNAIIERTIEDKKYYKRYKANSDKSQIVKGMICSHQCFFIRTEKLKSIGGFDQRFNIAADWDSIIRLFKETLKIKYLDVDFCICDMDGISSHPHAIERHEVRKKNELYKRIDVWMIRDLMHDMFSSIANIILSEKIKKKISVKVKRFNERQLFNK